MDKKRFFVEKEPVQRIPAEVTERQREAVRGLENLEGVEPRFKALILATAHGVKPASEFDLVAIGDEAEWRNVQRKTEDVLKELGLHFMSEPMKVEDFEKCDWKSEYYISQNKQQAQYVHQLFTTARPFTPENDAKVGAALGIPQTAIEAWRKSRETKDDSTLLPQPKEWEQIGRAHHNFLFFRFSKEHYAEELAFVRKIIKLVQRVSPKIYNEITWGPPVPE